MFHVARAIYLSTMQRSSGKSRPKSAPADRISPPVSKIHEPIQEDIVLEPRVAVPGFVHQQAHCADCDRDVHAQSQASFAVPISDRWPKPPTFIL